MLCGQALADIKIGTWNIGHLSTRSNKDIISIAKVAKQVDFLAIQEVMSEEALHKLVHELSVQSRHKWSSMVSHPIGRSSYKEMYGFIWRDDAISYEDGAVVYLDNRDVFEREPYSARFKSLKDDTYFVAATVHILYGKSKANRTPEINALSEYWSWLKEAYSESNQFFLMGDFNMTPSSSAWNQFRSIARPLIVTGASTLSTVDGRFSNLYDNIFISRDAEIIVKSAIIFNYPKYLGVTHAQGRRRISDHAPIFAEVKLINDGNNQSTPNHKVQAGNLRPHIAQQGYIDETLIIGNKRTMIYHKPECPSYSSVSPKNRIELSSEQEAISKNYRLARNCKRTN